MLQDFLFFARVATGNLLLNHKTVEPRCTCRLRIEHNSNLNSTAEIDMSFNRVFLYNEQRGSISTSGFTHS